MSKKVNKLVRLINKKIRVHTRLSSLRGREAMASFYNENRVALSSKIEILPKFYTKKAELTIKNKKITKKLNKFINKMR